MNEEPENFLARWSRRKRQSAVAPVETSVDASSEAALRERTATELAESDVADGETTARACDSGDEETASASAPDFSDVDFEGLDFSSDYTPFMGENVSDEMRNKALRKLWISNPVLANIDGLDDYCEDYTDAAVCLPKGLMKTAYRYGRGFLDDDEVAEWEALGRPEPAGEDNDGDGNDSAHESKLSAADTADRGDTADHDATEARLRAEPEPVELPVDLTADKNGAPVAHHRDTPPESA